MHIWWSLVHKVSLVYRVTEDNFYKKLLLNFQFANSDNLARHAIRYLQKASYKNIFLAELVLEKSEILYHPVKVPVL